MKRDTVEKLWQVKDILYNIYGHSYSEPEVQMFVANVAQQIRDFLRSQGEDPIALVKS